MTDMIDKPLKDSGARRTFESGAVRDKAQGKGRFDLLSPFVLERLARHYEKGANKYAARNWEKGMQFSVCLDSALRHANQFHAGATDEDHLIAALWNLAALVHYEEMLKRGILPQELNDLPNYQPIFVSVPVPLMGDICTCNDKTTAACQLHTSLHSS